MADAVDLESCAREPIQIPGSIQPHGVMFVLQPVDLKVVQVSQNCETMLGVRPMRVLDKGLGCVLNESQLEQVRSALAASDPYEANPVQLGLASRLTGEQLDGVVHSYEGFDFLELEPSERAIQSYFLDFYKNVSGSTHQLQTAPGFDELYSAAANGIRRVTGFGRVLICKFADNGDGEVVAESKSDWVESFMGLRYPASDIPEQARRLYILSPFRLIPDARYVPSPLIPEINPVSGKPTDLSFASLRSMSPIHREYLQNMGVAASMSVSIVRSGWLWGVIVCHNDTPKRLGYETRRACAFLGQVLSGEIARRESEAEKGYALERNVALSRLLGVMAGKASPLAALGEEAWLLLELIPAQGAAVVDGDTIWKSGQTPEIEEIRTLCDALRPIANSGVFVTDKLMYGFPSLERLRATAAGVIVLEISRAPLRLMYFFRGELAQTVNWAGDPDKAVISSEGGARLSPRRSFALWKEQLHATSAPWSRTDVEVAETLRQLILTAEIN